MDPSLFLLFPKSRWPGGHQLGVGGGRDFLASPMEAMASFIFPFSSLRSSRWASKAFEGCGWAFDTPFAFCGGWASMGPLVYLLVRVGPFVGFIVWRWVISSTAYSFVEFARLTTRTYVLVCAAFFRSLRWVGWGNDGGTLPPKCSAIIWGRLGREGRCLGFCAFGIGLGWGTRRKQLCKPSCKQQSKQVLTRSHAHHCGTLH